MFLEAFFKLINLNIFLAFMIIRFGNILFDIFASKFRDLNSLSDNFEK